MSGMKNLLTKICWPILSFFETGEEAKGYKKSHRVVLIVVGLLFVFLSLFSGVSAYFDEEPGALIPFAVFFCVGSVSLVVGALGSNGAVSTESTTMCGASSGCSRIVSASLGSSSRHGAHQVAHRCNTVGAPPRNAARGVSAPVSSAIL